MLAIISMLACLFALSVSAAEWFGAVEIIDNDGDGASDIVISDMLPQVIEKGNAEGLPASEDALVKLNCTCEAGEHTFPAYYICTKKHGTDGTTLYELPFASLNAALKDYCGNTAGLGINNITAFEAPNGYTIGDTHLFNKNSKSLKYLSFAKASTLTTLGNAVSGYNWIEASPVEEVNFGPYVTVIPSFMCYNCDSLTSVVIPDQVTSIGSDAFFGCDNLTTVKISNNSQLASIGARAFKNCAKIGAFYIPASLTSFGASGSGASPIDGCKSLYFVNDPNATEKSSVYYFPSTLTSFVGETFKNCTSLNDVLVFPSIITSVENGWAFNNTNKVSLVFLGNIETLHKESNGSWNVSKIYFCNENDKTAADFKIGKGYSYSFCNADGNTDHLYLVNETLAADCENNAKTQTRCFCGKVEKMVEEPNTALGHDHDYVNGKAELLAIVYADLSKDGTKTVKCGVCGKSSDLTANKVIEYKGYSKNDKGAMCMGYNIDQTALKDYESKNGALSFGFVASANNNAPLEANGDKKENVVKADLTGSTYNAVDFILTAKDWTAESAANAEISINLYVIVNNAVKYITASGYSDTTEATKYSDIV